jgi:HEAT repeat protein
VFHQLQLSNISNQLEQIVSKESARGLSTKLIPIDTNHSGLNKCRSSSDQIFHEISKAVKTMTSLPPLLSRADRWILDRYANDRRLWVQRISGERLPMDSCYVNLNIVQQNVRGGQHVDHIQPPNLPEETWRLNDGERIILSDLFKLRKFPGEEEERRPRRILIRGRPGVGKSTLCKKIMDDFLQLQRTRNLMKDHGNVLEVSNGYSYCSHLARILWVPLQDLAARRKKSDWDLILGAYFVPIENPEAEAMAKALKAHLQDPYTEDETLFLLDGMDEIAAILQDESDLKVSIDWLLGQRNVIVTSRPTVRFDHSLKQEAFDIELETIGFLPREVQAYVEKVAGNKAQGIWEFLMRRPLIQDLVRIPVQLDALCFAWQQEERGGGAFSNSKESSAPETMTELYQVIERALWRKDAIRLGRMNQNDTPFAADIEKAMEKEILLLERLAFHGLQHHLTIFDTPFLEDWLGQLPNRLIVGDKGLDGILQSSSFLRSPDLTQYRLKRNYYFLHLTQQEYFAARYLKRQWIDRDAESVDAIAFFRNHKYSERFDVVWSFLTGLLGSSDPRCHQLGFKAKHDHVPKCLKADQLESFFKEVQGEPFDMLGPTHQRLVMHCLHEVRPSRFLSVRDRLEKQVEKWLLFEFDFMGDYRYRYYGEPLALETECPEYLIEKILLAAGDHHKACLLRSIRRRYTANTTIMDLVTSWIKRSQNEYLIEECLSMFEICPDLWIPDDSVQVIVERLGDSNFNIRASAIEIVHEMTKIPRLSQLALEELVQRLDTHNEVFCEAALRVITLLPSPPELLIQTVDHLHSSNFFRLQEADPELLSANRDLLLAVAFKVLGEWIQRTELAVCIPWHAISVIMEQPALHVYLVQNLVQRWKSNDSEQRSLALEFFKFHDILPEAVAIELTQDLVTCDIPRANNMSRGPDNENDKQKVAFEILSLGLPLSETVLRKLTHSVTDGIDPVKRYACVILQHQTMLPETVLNSLAQTFGDGDPISEEGIAKILKSQWDLPESAFKSLLRSLRHKDHNSQIAALKALPLGGNIPEPILDQIGVLLGNKDKDIRKRVLEALGESGEDRRPYLSESILCQIDGRADDEHESVQYLALGILSKFSDRRKWIDSVEKMLGAKDPSIRSLFLRTVAPHYGSSTLTLGRRARCNKFSPLALDRMAQMIGDDHQMIGDDHQMIDDDYDWIIGSLLGKSIEPLPPEVVRTLVRKLKDEDPRTRIATLKALVHISIFPQVIVKVIEQMFEDFDQNVRLAVMSLLQNRPNLFQIPIGAMMDRLQDEDEATQQAAVDLYLSQDNPEDSMLPYVLQALEFMHDGPNRCAHVLSSKLRPLYDSWSDTYPKLRPLDDSCAEFYPKTQLLEFLAHHIGHGYDSADSFLQVFAKQQSVLPSAVRDLLWQKTGDVDSRVRESASDILTELDWSKNKVHLSTEVLRYFSVSLKESPDSLHPSFLAIILKQPELATFCASEGVLPGLYRFLLRQSFEDHFIWLHQSNDTEPSGDQSHWCYQTMGEDVKNELVKARRTILGPDLAQEA